MEALAAKRFEEFELENLGGSQILAKLGMTTKHALELFKWFVSVVPQRGESAAPNAAYEIRLSRLLNALRLRNKPFAFAAFISLDHSCSHVIRFVEFLLGAWNMCTLPPNCILRYLLSYVQNEDVEDKGVDPATLIRIVKLTYKYGTERDTFLNTTNRLINALNIDSKGKLQFSSLSEEYNSKAPAYDYLVVGLEQVKTQITKTILGKEFWEPISKARTRRITEATTADALEMLRVYHWFCSQPKARDIVLRLKNTQHISRSAVVLGRIQAPIRSQETKEEEGGTSIIDKTSPEECAFSFVEPTVQEQVVHALSVHSPVVILGSRTTISSDTKFHRLPNGLECKEVTEWYRVATDQSGDIEWVPKHCVAMSDPSVESNVNLAKTIEDDSIIPRKLKQLNQEWIHGHEICENGQSMRSYWYNPNTGKSTRADPTKVFRSLS